MSESTPITDRPLTCGNGVRIRTNMVAGSISQQAEAICASVDGVIAPKVPLAKQGL